MRSSCACDAVVKKVTYHSKNNRVPLIISRYRFRSIGQKKNSERNFFCLFNLILCLERMRVWLLFTIISRYNAAHSSAAKVLKIRLIYNIEIMAFNLG